IAIREEAIDIAVKLLLEGRILAVKGLGGFHIACLPEDGPVALLRERKKRPHKPFAVMVRDMETAQSVVCTSPEAERMMCSPRSPIVICPKKEGENVSGLLAPGQDTLGVMLPYTPLHHLLMEHIPILVMTSANFSESPILATNEEALRDLANLVDYLLLHDRRIQNRIDDSVVTFAGKKQILLRRARGFVPHPVVAAKKLSPVLACGPEMKSTFALSLGKSVIASQYLGDLKRLETALYYENTLRHFLDLFRFSPRLVVKDMHPQYVSGYIADRVLGEGIESLKVQHHHAHMASCLLEKGLEGPVIGLILDGTGYGTDGSIWGGEILFGDCRFFKRAGHLRQAPLPGGEKAIKEPWRYALSLLIETFGKDEAIEKAFRLWPAYGAIIPAVAESSKESPVSSSCGRLFDAIAALSGVRSRITYDGQAAMELEACAEGDGGKSVPFHVLHEDDGYIVDWRPAVSWILANLEEIGPHEVAGAFHVGLAEALAEACLNVSGKYGVQKVVLSGGVWQNRRLLSLAVAALRGKNLEPLWHSSLSPNDEAVSVGQIAVGAAYLKG
ncbi:MAG: carbamoyltransferase HypF, partial [Thermovirgaceae bacterium]